MSIKLVFLVKTPVIWGGKKDLKCLSINFTNFFFSFFRRVNLGLSGVNILWIFGE